MKRVVLIVPSYNGCMRLTHLLESIEVHDSRAIMPSVTHAGFDRVMVIHDPDPTDPSQREAYDALAKRFKWIELIHLSNWSNMHGAAQAAFDASRKYSPDWVVYLGDDVQVTPGALTNMLDFIRANELKTVGLIQFPYWNAHELCANSYSEFQGPSLLTVKEDMFALPKDWLHNVPRNPHWDNGGAARMYINVNGVGFACKTDMFARVGGFAKGTWCLDESIAVKAWVDSQACITIPGPPLVHYFGGATLTNPQPHSLHTEEAWIEAMGLTKAEAGTQSRNHMERLAEKVNVEISTFTYPRRD